MKSLLSAIGKWFLAQGIAVKAAVAVVGVAIIATGGTAAYLGISSANKPTNNNAIVVDKQDPITESKQDTTPNASENKDTNTEKGDSTEESKPSDSATDTTPGSTTENDDNDEESDDYVPFVKTGTDLINGTFADGINGFEVYAQSEDAISYTADAKNGFQITIRDTGSEDWHVQLKQGEIKLVKGKWYRLSMDAKSTLNRNITSVMQHNGLYDDVWTPYSQSNLMALTNTWKTFTTIFQMNEATDEDAVFNVSMGTINGAAITKEHTIGLRNIKLEMLPDSWLDSLRSGANLIANGDFGYEDMLWDTSVVAPGASKVTFADNKATFDISNPGTLDWHVQLKQNGISLKKDTGYRLTFTASSSSARTIKVGFMDTNYVDWYGGADIALAAGQEQFVTVEFKNTIATNPAALMMISMGKIEGQDTPASTVILKNFVLVEADVTAPSYNATAWKDPNTKLANGFTVYDHESTHTNGSSYDDEHGYAIHVRNVGTEEWHVQMQKKNVLLEKGNWYRVSFKVRSTTKRPISFMLQHDGALDNDWTPYSKTDGSQIINMPESTEMYSFDDWTTYTQVFEMTADTDPYALFNFGLGKVNGTNVNCMHTVWIYDIVLEKTEAPGIESVDYYTEILEEASSYVAEDQNAAATVTTDGDKVIYNITKPGTEDWHVQHKYSNLVLEKGCTYEFTINASSTPARAIKVDIMDGTDYDWYGGETLELTEPQSGNGRSLLPAFGNQYIFRFTMTKETTANAILQISLGKMAAVETPASVVTLSNMSLMKVEATPDDAGNSDEGDASNQDVILGRNLLKNGDFANGETPWESYFLEAGKGTKTVGNGKAQFNITNVGEDTWHVQLKQTGLTLKKGSTYQFSYKITSTVEREYVRGLQSTTYHDYFGGSATVPANEEVTVTKQFTMTENTDDDVILYFNLGGKDVTLDSHTLTITDVKLCKVLENEGDDDEFVEESNTPADDNNNNDNGNNGNDDNSDNNNTNSITITKTGWSETEIPVASLVGDYNVADIAAIKFTGDMKFAIGYTNTAGGWTGYADDADRTTTYTCNDILLAITDIGGETKYPTVKIGIYFESGTHTITWEVIPSDGEGGSTPPAGDDSNNDNNDNDGNGDNDENSGNDGNNDNNNTNSITITKTGWSETEIPVTSLVGDYNVADIAAIKFTGDMKFAIGYTNTAGGWTGYADDADRTTTYTCNDILLAITDIGGETKYPTVKIGIYFESGTHTITWEVITSDSEGGSTPPAGDGDSDDPVISGNTLTIKKFGWTEPEISVAALLGDIDPSQVTAIKFTGDINFGVAYTNTSGDWSDYVPDAQRTTTYTLSDIDLTNASANIKIGIYFESDSHTISWELIGNTGSVTYTTLGWSEPQIPISDILGSTNPNNVASITFTSDIYFGVGYTNTEGTWTGYVPDAERTNSYTFNDILLEEKYIGDDKKYPTIQIGIYIGEGAHDIKWQVNLK